MGDVEGRGQRSTSRACASIDQTVRRLRMIKCSSAGDESSGTIADSKGDERNEEGERRVKDGGDSDNQPTKLKMTKGENPGRQVGPSVVARGIDGDEEI